MLLTPFYLGSFGGIFFNFSFVCDSVMIVLMSMSADIFHVVQYIYRLIYINLNVPICSI